MKNAPDLNAALEGRLPKALDTRLARSRPGERDPACLDEETLAAWADQALKPRERAAVDAHAADCGRCQALLAAMVRTAQPAAAAKSVWWRTSTVKWLAPLTAAAAAFLLWITLPTRQGVELRDRVATAAGAPSREAPPARTAAPTPVPQSAVPQNATPQTAVASKSTPPAANTLQRQASRDRNAEPPRLEEKQTDALNAPAEADKKAIAESANVAAQAAAAPATPAPLPSKAAAEVAQRRAGAPVAAAESLARARSLDAATAEIRSTSPMTRWRIVRGGGGAVERSADGGATWQLQQTGAGVTLAAGTSPSPSVCWMVGPGGLVVLQTDGSTWRRIGFPEQVNLVSIRATDERQATVSTADGRSFETHDGGLTWTRSPGA